MLGTARYASINTHLGIEQSRRDDMEALGYVFVYFLKGALPWQGLKAKNKVDKYQVIKNVKVSTTVETLCKGLPNAFAEYISICRFMKFDETPNYDKMKGLFRSVLN